VLAEVRRSFGPAALGAGSAAGDQLVPAPLHLLWI